MRKFGVSAAALVAAISGVMLAPAQAGDAAERAASSGFNPDSYVSFSPVYFSPTIYATGSFLRFANGSSVSSTFNVQVFGYPSGTQYTTSALAITVPAHGSPQKSAADIHDAVIAAGGPDITPKNGDTAITLFVQNAQAGSGVAVQHVTFNGLTGYFEDVSVCTFDPAFAIDTIVLNGALFNVHTTSVAGYPSTVQIFNPDATSRVVTATVYDATTGSLLGSYKSTVPANGSSAQTMAQIQTALGFTPTSSQYHVNIFFTTGDSSAYDAIPSHSVTQTSSGVTFNLTSACQLNPAHPVKSTGTGGSNPSSSSSSTGTGSNPSSS